MANSLNHATNAENLLNYKVPSHTNLFNKLSRASRAPTKRTHNDTPITKPYAPNTIPCINSMKLGTP